MAHGDTLRACADAYALAEAIAHLCEDPHPDGDGWRARCPNHQGKSDTSFSITPSNDRVLIKCFAECPAADVVHAMGLKMSDLFLHASMPRNGTRRIVQVYDYFDAAGTLIHQTVRYDPKGFNQRRPDPVTPGEFIYDIKTIDLVLYHLPEVLSAIANDLPVYVVEGEKDADRLLASGYTATCNPMGAGKWRKSYSETLRGAHVVLLADYDGPGERHMEKVAQYLASIAADIKLIRELHTNTPGSDISDWIDAGGTREDFDRIVAEAPYYTGQSGNVWTERVTTQAAQQPTPPPVATPPSGIVIEQYKHLLPQVVAQAQDALLHMPGAPHVFQRARRLVAVAPAEKTAKGITRAAGTPIISALTAPRLRAFLASAAAWMSPNASQKVIRPDMPQPWVVETLLDQEEWPFPPLTGIVTSPTLRPDGSLVLTQGYDAHTGLWLAWHDETFPAVHDAPTRADAQTALRFLAEPFQDFPFAALHHQSAAIAAVLTLIARYAVQSVPLFAIRATTRGSGKTLLADCIAMIATGRHAPKMPQVKEEEEERKRLLALALDGDPLVVIDNVVGALGNPALDLAVTSQLFKDRLLGKNATKEAPLFTVFLATGNNMFFKGDMARRAIPIDLAPLMEHPETRASFTHPRLLDWIQHERPRLISAALTLLRAYWVADKPRQPIDAYGSFELWSDVIRSALVWAGAPDPCLGREGLEAASDETFEAHAELLAAWWACYGHTPVALATIIGDLQTRTSPANTPAPQRTETMMEWDCLREALSFFDSKSDGQRLSNKALGHALKRLSGRVINGKRLQQLPERSKYGTLWTVQTVEQLLPPSGVFDVFGVITPRSSLENHEEKTQKISGAREETNALNTQIHQGDTSNTPGDTCPQCHADDIWIMTDTGQRCAMCGYAVAIPF